MNDDIVIIKEGYKKEKGPKKPFQLWEKILISISLIFIMICIFFYGFRLIKYYKIFNPKIDGENVTLIMNSVVSKSTIVYENDGLYRVSGMYIYKGENVNNYIMYSNMLWRILRFNIDGSLDITLDDSINMLKWNNEVTNFTSSDVYKYLNNYFYKKLDNMHLTVTPICDDEITDLSKITCDNKNVTSYVRLLSVSDYLNSKVEGSYLETNSNIWLSNRNVDTIWNINKNSLSSSDSTNMYYIKPVVTLKNTTKLLSGDGTKSNPYIVSEKSLGIGSYVKLDDDVWVIYDKDSNYHLSLTKSLDIRAFGNDIKFDVNDESNIAYYLNDEYYNSLSYKNKLVSADWYDGTYNSYDDILKSSVSSKVGLLNVDDLKFDSKLNNYYLLTPSTEDKIYLYSDTITDSKVSLNRNIIPTISLDEIKVLSGNGTIDDPYVVEV